MTPEDERFMSRALELARIAPFTSPNPRVGAVLVRDHEIVAEGFHRGAGTPHAEAMALAAAEVGAGASGTTLYVNLEPCSHTGQTPPCAPAVAGAGVARVVAALEDPDPRVSGAGLSLLRSRGVEVVTGVLAGEARLLNASFLHRAVTGRCLMSLKLALSLDGRFAAPDGSSRWITGEETRRYVHRRRAGADAVMVGAGTIAADDPALDVRDVSSEHQPVKVVVDATGRVDPTARVFHRGDVIVATTGSCPHDRQTAYKEAGAEVLILPSSPRGVDLDALIAAFAERGWLEVLCEGGAELATSLLAADLVDLVELHYGPVLLGGGPVLGDLGVRTMSQGKRYETAGVHRLGDDAVVTLLRRPA